MANPKRTLAAMLMVLCTLFAAGPNLGCAATPEQKYAIAVDLKTAAQTAVEALLILAPEKFTDAQIDVLVEANGAAEEAQAKARAALDAGDAIGREYWLGELAKNRGLIAKIYAAITGKDVPSTRPNR